LLSGRDVKIRMSAAFFYASIMQEARNAEVAVELTVLVN